MIILSPALHTEANNSYLQAALNCQTKKENFFKKKKKHPVQAACRLWCSQPMGGAHVVDLACPPSFSRAAADCGQPGQTHPLKLAQGMPEPEGSPKG
jgi:hypothetical protein